MQRRIFLCIRPFDWFAAINLKDAYFHVSILPRHRPFLCFAFEGRAYQCKALHFGLSLSPRVFTKVMEEALVPLKEAVIHILNYIDDWLILAQSRALLCEHRDTVLSHLRASGQLGKEQTLPYAEDLFSWGMNKWNFPVESKQNGAEDGSRVASSGKTLQFFVCFICFFVVLRVRCC